MSSLVMTTAEVAAALNLTVAYFRKRRRRLPGFPQPLPGNRTWSRAKVEAWLADGGKVSAGKDASPAARDDSDETAAAARRRDRRERAKQLAVGGAP